MERSTSGGILGVATFLALGWGVQCHAFERLTELTVPSDPITGRSAMSPDGQNIYAVEDNPADILRVLGRDASTGALTELSVETPAGFFQPGCPAVSLDGEHLYVPTDTGPFVFDRDPSDGSLSFVESLAGASGSRAFVSHDGQNVYVTAGAGTEVYARDPLTGSVTFVEAIDHLVGVLSADGRHAYAGSPSLTSLAVLDRDPASGKLTLVTTIRTKGHVMALTPDDTQLYVLSGTEAGSITGYDRDSVTGLLTKLFEFRHPLGSQFAGHGDLAFVPDGSRLVMKGKPFEATHVFDRDLSSGELAVHDSREFHLSNPIVSPDGMYIYGWGPNSAFGYTDITCTAVPAVGCHLAEKSLLKLSDNGGTSRDKLVWKWSAAVDTPLGGTLDYSICLYDASASPQPVLERVAPGGGFCKSGAVGTFADCWRFVSGREYRDKSARDGLVKVKLRPGSKTSIRVIGRGDRLAPPPLPLALPLVVQLQNDDGTCWEATYAVALANGAGAFTAKLP